MKYMLLVCGDDTNDASGMAPVEPWVEELGDRGVRQHGHRLALPADAVTVRVRGGEVLRTDGPFAETKEYVAGFDILECDSLEEAVEAAARAPRGLRRGHGGAAVLGGRGRRGGDPPPRRRTHRAARDRDLSGMLACYTPDVEVFHPMTGLEQSGIDAFRKAQECVVLHRHRARGPRGAGVPAPGRRERRVQPRAGADAGHADHGERLDSTLRVTTGYRLPADRWLIAHQHTSVAFDAGIEEDRS